MDEKHYDKAVRYALSIPGLSVAVMGLENIAELERAASVVANSAPLSPEESQELARVGLQLSATPFTDREGKTVSTLGGSAWAVPKGSKNPVAACAWAKEMTSTQTWMKAAEARVATVEKEKSIFTGLFTANKAADDQIREQHLKPVQDAGFQTAIETFYGALDAARAVNPSAAGAEIDAAWKAAVQRALEGQPADQALKQAQSEAQKAFDSVSGRG
jgi:multiple sugar transport system substrate-binding protein